MLAEWIISKFSREHVIHGLKITSHQHTNTEKAVKIKEKAGIVLLEETDPGSVKDTGRMLAAGAQRAFLLQTTDTEVAKGIGLLTGILDSNALIVCESGKVLKAGRTAVHLFVRHLNCQKRNIEKELQNRSADRLVTYTINGFDLDLDSIFIKNNQWYLKQQEV